MNQLNIGGLIIPVTKICLMIMLFFGVIVQSLGSRKET